jgi:hypothetical protein
MGMALDGLIDSVSAMWCAIAARGSLMKQSVTDAMCRKRNTVAAQ